MDDKKKFLYKIVRKKGMTINVITVSIISYREMWRLFYRHKLIAFIFTH